MRVVFDAAKLPIDIAKVRARFADIGTTLSMEWSLRSTQDLNRVFILVSALRPLSRRPSLSLS